MKKSKKKPYSKQEALDKNASLFIEEVEEEIECTDPETGKPIKIKCLVKKYRSHNVKVLKTLEESEDTELDKIERNEYEFQQELVDYDA